MFSERVGFCDNAVHLINAGTRTDFIGMGCYPIGVGGDQITNL